MKVQTPRNSQNHPKELQNSWNTSPPWTSKTWTPWTARLFTKLVIKIVCYQQKDSQTDQWNRIEHPATEPHIKEHFCFWFTTKDLHHETEGKRGLFNRWFVVSQLSVGKNISLASLLTPYKEVNFRSGLSDNNNNFGNAAGECLHDIGVSNSRHIKQQPS